MTILHHPLEQFLGIAQQVAIWVGEEESGEAVLWEGSHRGRNASLVCDILGVGLFEVEEVEQALCIMWHFRFLSQLKL